MSDKFPRIPIRKIESILHRMGYKCVRQTGSHMTFKRPNSRSVRIPHKGGKDLAVKTVKSELKRAKVYKEFMEIYNRKRK